MIRLKNLKGFQLADEGPPMAALLQSLIRVVGRVVARQSPERSVNTLTKSFGRSGPRWAPRHAWGRPGGDRADRTPDPTGAGGSWIHGRREANRQIADELVVTLDTVKRHVSHIFDKLGAANRTEAVARARELRLIP